MTPEYKYSAFISYNHADKKAARRLHRELERVRFKDTNSAERRSLFPVFIDGQEMLGGNDLDDELKISLEKSKFLIVVCTSNSTASPTVKQEIEHFKTLPQAKNIIPVILDRFEDLESCCFPKPLGFRENGAKSLAINLGGENVFKRKIDRLSLMKIAAPIAGVSLQELWSREQRRLRRNKALIVASVALAMIGSIVYWDLFHRQFDDGYTNFYRTPDGWNGIQPVSENTGQHYRFIKKGRLGKPHTAWLRNGNVLCDRLVPTTKLDLYSLRFSAINQNNPNVLRLCKASFSYRDNGKIEMETLHTSTEPNGQGLQLIEEFKYPINVCMNSDVVFSSSLDCTGELRTGLGRFEVKVGYDKKRLSKISTRQTSGARRGNGGAFTSHYIEYKYNDINQLNGIDYRNFQGDFVANLQFEYRDGYLTRMYMPDHDGSSPISNEFDQLLFDYDTRGRLKEKRLLKDNRMMNQGLAYLIGNPEDYQQPKNDSYVSYGYENQNEVNIQFRNQDGKVIEILGVSEVRKTTHKGDFVWAFYDLDGHKTEDSNGLHKTVSESSKNLKTRTLNRTWYNKDGEQVVGPHGYFRMEVTNRRRYSGEGLSGIRLSKGLMVNRYFYNEKMELTEDENGLAYLKAEYDLQDRIIQLTLHDSKHELQENSLGIAKAVWDARSNKQKCYSTDGNLIVLKAQRSNNPAPEKIACARENFYEYSMIVAQKVDVNEPDKILGETYALGQSLSDRRVTGKKTFMHRGGGIVIERGVDYILNQNSLLKNLGIQKKWNGGILLEEGFYDLTFEERANNQYGYSFARYDLENKVSGAVQILSFYDKDENPVQEVTTGAYTLVNHFDPDNRVIKQLFYDAERKPRTENYYSIMYDYRDSENRMFATAYDQAGNVFPTQIGGVKFSSLAYSERNMMGAYTRKHFLDENERPVTLRDGTYSVQLETDQISNQTIQVWKNEQGTILGRAPIYLSSILSW